ncbi:MAG: PilT protein domain protein [Solirubrobacterales bacterium]|jgi:predicted nucleic acid-binding protein|nr:PilT protein domain protein [Solirubrobacterales bacterium]
MPVLDASVVVEYIGGGEHAEAARSRIIAGPALWAPHLVDAEVGHVLRRAVLTGELTAALAEDALADLAALPIQRVGHLGLLDRAWALRGSLSFYDGLYVALAERVDLPLLTLDARLAAAPGIRAQIDVIP